MITAEWICTNCQTTNRALAAPGQTELTDKCITCRQIHVVRPDERPVRWRATRPS